MLRAVLFDLDDTLFDHQECSRCALSGVRDLHPGLAALAPDELERHHARILEELHVRVSTGELPLEQARLERFRRLYEAAGEAAEQDLVARTATVYRDRYIAARREIAGASVLLTEVRRYAQVVVVSNNLLHEQQEKLRHCGLDRFVDVLVVSEEVGVAKPDPQIFEVALARAGCTASEAVMVGDSWTNDVEGALRAGIRAVWFNRTGAAAPDPAVPVITSLEPASAVLAVLGVRS